MRATHFRSRRSFIKCDSIPSAPVRGFRRVLHRDPIAARRIISARPTLTFARKAVRKRPALQSTSCETLNRRRFIIGSESDARTRSHSERCANALISYSWCCSYFCSSFNVSVPALAALVSVSPCCGAARVRESSRSDKSCSCVQSPNPDLSQHCSRFRSYHRRSPRIF